MDERADGAATPGQRDHHGRGERVAKAIARAGLTSRREAERWIAEGRVTVNAEVIGSPAITVCAEDIVAVDGKALPRRERTRLFLFHKPRGFLTSHGDPHGRPTIFDLLPRHLPRLISVGRLDRNTEGLLLLTNDGSLARVLELPSTGWLRRYRVRAHGSVTQDQLDRLRGGISVDGINYGPIEAGVDRVQGSNLWMTFAIREGKNREVKNVLGHLGLAVNRLIRVSFGPFRLGDLAPSGIEEVRTRVLREQLGARIAALTNADFSAPAVTATIPAPVIPAERAGLGPASERRNPVTKAVRPFTPAVITGSRLARARLQPGSLGRDDSTPGNEPGRRRKSRSASDHIGEPERARREKRRGRRSSRHKQR